MQLRSKSDPKWWHVLASHFPGSTESHLIEKSAGPTRSISLVVPELVEPKTTAEALARAIELMSRTRSTANSWFWKARSQPATEAVVTPSGSLASKYVSVWALAVAEPTAELCFASHLAKSILDAAKGRRAVVVSDGPLSSYLLLSRLRKRIERDMPGLAAEISQCISFAHPDDLQRSIGTAEVLIIYSDAVFTGHNIRSMREKWQRYNDRPVVVCSIDLNPRRLPLEAGALARIMHQA